MDYILSGDPKEVRKVIRENRIRVERGLIQITPFQPEEVDNKETFATDSKDVALTDTKEVKTSKKTKTNK